MKAAMLSAILEDSRSGFWGSEPGSGEVDVRVVRNGDIQEDGVRWDALPLRSVSRSEAERALLRKGDILITTSGDCGYTAHIESDPEHPTIASNFVRILRFDPARVVARYAFHFLHSRAFRSSLAPYIRGTTLKNLSFSTVAERIELPLLTSDAQRRSVTLMDNADALRAKRLATLTQLDDLSESLFVELFGNPIRNERQWPLAKLGEIARVERGKFTPRPRNDPSYYGGEFPFVQTGDISRCGGRLRSWSQTLNEKGRSVSRSFPPGTVVVAIVGATLGVTAILDVEVYCPDSVVGVQPDKDKAFAEYVERVLRFWRPIFVAQAPETARANINLETLRPLKIPVPPISLQEEFCRQVAGVERVKGAQEASLAEMDALLATLHHRAFRGEL